MGFIRDIVIGRDLARKRDARRLQRISARKKKPNALFVFIGKMVATIEYYCRPAITKATPYGEIIKGDLRYLIESISGKIDERKKRDEEYHDFLENCGFKKD
jgi:hypothetical protein